MPRYWVVQYDWRVGEQLNDLLGQEGGVTIANAGAIYYALHPVHWTKPTGYYGNARLPDDFMRPELCMPENGFAPDFLSIGSTRFASRRLRDAFAQSDTVIQYFPIDLLGGGPAVRTQDYRWMNILACQPAIDRERSEYEIGEGTNSRTGETFRYLHHYERMVIRDDIGPGMEIFRVADDLSTMLAADSLAERVMQAGCTGISFEDPETFCTHGTIHRYRTGTGIEEEDLDKIFSPPP